MIFDPDEIVTLGGAPMTLRDAVARVQAIPASYRSLATIVHRGEPALLDIDAIEAIAVSPAFLPKAEPVSS
jgi:hypothetical protein